MTKAAVPPDHQAAVTLLASIATRQMSFNLRVVQILETIRTGEAPKGADLDKLVSILAEMLEKSVQLTKAA